MHFTGGEARLREGIICFVESTSQLYSCYSTYATFLDYMFTLRIGMGWFSSFVALRPSSSFVDSDLSG